MRKFVLPALIAVLLLCGCGPKAITRGSRPFPSEKNIFADASGRILSDLPDAGESVRLVFLDFPWCLACQNAWDSVRDATETAPPASMRIYRVLFDEEVLLTASGKKETAPLRSAPPPWPAFREDAENMKVTTLTALSETFLETFRVSRSPVLLLINRNGVVEKRWDGYSTNLTEELAAELKKTVPLH